MQGMKFHGRWGLAAALLVAGACDQGSVGEFEATESGSGGSSTTGVASAGTSGPGSATDASASASASATSSATTVDPTDDTSGGGLLLDVGTGSVCAGIDAHQCAGPVDCGENCGALDSMFDEYGCVRQACSATSACDDGFFCYRPQDYDGCQSSDVGCVESSEGNCECGTLPDCGGAYCVPEEIVFGGIAGGPTEGLAENICGPVDQDGFTIRVGTYASNACGGDFEAAPLLTLNVDQASGSTGTFTPGVGSWVEAWYAADGVPENAQIAEWVVVRITEWGDDTLQGDYEVRLTDGTLLVGSLSDVLACDSDTPLPCG